MKICIRCRQDCGDRPRKRDSEGRYHCQECLDRRHAERAASAPGAPDAPAGDGLDPIPLEVLESPRKEVRVGRVDPHGGRPCPMCGQLLPSAAVICVSCGYNAQTGRKLPAPSRKKSKDKVAAKCTKCGYSLRGLETPRCPECGTMNLMDDARRAYDREVSRSVARQAYRQPLLMFVIGAAIVCVALALSSSFGPAAIPAYFIGFAIQLPVGLGVYWMCCVVWLGFDAPFHLTALRLLGIYAVADAARVVVYAIAPWWLIATLVSGVVYIHLLSELLEMDLADAVIVGLLTFITKVMVVLFLLPYLLSSF